MSLPALNSQSPVAREVFATTTNVAGWVIVMLKSTTWSLAGESSIIPKGFSQRAMLGQYSCIWVLRVIQRLGVSNSRLLMSFGRPHV